MTEDHKKSLIYLSKGLINEEACSYSCWNCYFHHKCGRYRNNPEISKRVLKLEYLNEI